MELGLPLVVQGGNPFISSESIRYVFDLCVFPGMAQIMFWVRIRIRIRSKLRLVTKLGISFYLINFGPIDQGMYNV